MSTVLQDLIASAIDSKMYSVGILIDLAKAFHTVDHSILIKKLANYGIRGTPLMCFKSYLEKRQQQVQCSGVLSERKVISYGVPLGSNLGPPLFILYINNLTNVSQLQNVVLFADDTTVLYEHGSMEELQKVVNSELKKLSKWFKTNRLSLNVAYSCYILFHTSKKKLPMGGFKIDIGGAEIQRVDNVKFWGVYIDETLTGSNHIKVIANKIAKNIGVIRRISYLISPKIC